jgi:hypothetical protein
MLVAELMPVFHLKVSVPFARNNVTRCVLSSYEPPMLTPLTVESCERISSSRPRRNVVMEGSPFPDILRFILIEILKVPSWRVDMTSFLAARASNPEPLGVYLGALNGPDSSLTLAEFIDRLEAGAMSDIGPDGSGVFRFGSRTKALPADAPHLRDNDYLSFRGFFVPSEVFRHIRLNYDRNPVTGQPRTVEADVEEAELLHGRSQEVAFEVYLTQEADVIAVMASYVALAQAPVRHFCAVVKGKLLKTNVGDQILITRRLALTGVGASDVTGDVMRVYAIKKNHLTHRCEVYMHTNVLS